MKTLFYLTNLTFIGIISKLREINDIINEVFSFNCVMKLNAT